MLNFLHLGPARCATTWQARVYGQHPEIFIPQSKDTEFFSHQYARGETWYREQFNKRTDQRCAGEICHRYFWHPDAPARAHAFNPDFKIILTLRDPWERLLSSYLYDRTLYLKREVSLSDYLELPVIKSTLDYSKNLAQWQKYFSPEQMLLTFYETLHQNPQQWLRPIWRHLKVAEYWNDSWMERSWEGRTARWEEFAHFAFSVSQILRRFGHYQFVGATKDKSWLEPLLYIRGKEHFSIAEDDYQTASRKIQFVYDNWEKAHATIPQGWHRP